MVQQNMDSSFEAFASHRVSATWNCSGITSVVLLMCVSAGKSDGKRVRYLVEYGLDISIHKRKD